VGKSTWLGLGTSSTAGVDYLHDALRAYPRKDFAADFFQKLGMFFYERRTTSAPPGNSTACSNRYADSAEAVLALYMIGAPPSGATSA